MALQRGKHTYNEEIILLLKTDVQLTHGTFLGEIFVREDVRLQELSTRKSPWTPDHHIRVRSLFAVHAVSSLPSLFEEIERQKRYWSPGTWKSDTGWLQSNLLSSLHAAATHLKLLREGYWSGSNERKTKIPASDARSFNVQCFVSFDGRNCFVFSQRHACHQRKNRWKLLDGAQCGRKCFLLVLRTSCSILRKYPLIQGFGEARPVDNKRTDPFPWHNKELRPEVCKSSFVLFWQILQILNTERSAFWIRRQTGQTPAEIPGLQCEKQQFSSFWREQMANKRPQLFLRISAFADATFFSIAHTFGPTWRNWHFLFQVAEIREENDKKFNLHSHLSPMPRGRKFEQSRVSLTPWMADGKSVFFYSFARNCHVLTGRSLRSRSGGVIPAFSVLRVSRQMRFWWQSVKVWWTNTNPPFQTLQLFFLHARSFPQCDFKYTVEGCHHYKCRLHLAEQSG